MVRLGLGDAGRVRMVAEVSGGICDELTALAEAGVMVEGKEPLAVLGTASGENRGEGEEAGGRQCFAKYYMEKNAHGIS